MREGRCIRAVGPAVRADRDGTDRRDRGLTRARRDVGIQPPGPRSKQVSVNDRIWAEGDHVATYAHRSLLPVEAVILLRHREALGGRVLEVGCGAGRVLGYLLELGGEVHGIDVSAAMVEYCRREYPAAEVTIGDLGDLSASVDGHFGAVIAADNVLDVFDDAERRRVLVAVRELLSPGGVLVFSTHNLAYIDGDRSAAGPNWGGRGAALLSKAVERPLADVARTTLALPRRFANRRRLAPLEHRAPDHAIVNDEAHDYALLHYYIGRDAQENQLNELGYELAECLEADARPVSRGQAGAGPWLHYVARAR